MVVKKTINSCDLREIRDHIENTSKDYIKVYTQAQLSLIDGVDTGKIKKSGNYLPVRVDSSKPRYDYKYRGKKKPFLTGYIRLDEIKYLFNKRSGKKLVIE